MLYIALLPLVPVHWPCLAQKNSVSWFWLAVYVQFYYCLDFPVSLGGITLLFCLSFASWEHHFARKCHLPDLLWPVMQPPGRDHKRGGRCHPQQTSSSPGTGSWRGGLLRDELRAGLHVSRPLPAAQLAHCRWRQRWRGTEHARRARACSQHPTPTRQPPLSLLTHSSQHSLLQLPESSCRVSGGRCQSGQLPQLRAGRENPHSSLWWRTEYWHLLLSLLLH